MTTILIKKKDTAGAPAAGDLTNAAGGAEIAVNTATKRIYTKDSGGNVVEVGTNPTATTMNGNLTFVPDATYDIGATGATRPRDIFMSRNLTVGGTMTVAGGINFNGNVTVGDSSADTLTINSTITSNLIFTDNTYDIGASGATRARTGYFGTSLVAPLVSTVTSASSNTAPASGGITVNNEGVNSGYYSSPISWNIGGGGGMVRMYTSRTNSAGGIFYLDTMASNSTYYNRVKVSEAGEWTWYNNSVTTGATAMTLASQTLTVYGPFVASGGTIQSSITNGLVSSADNAANNGIYWQVRPYAGRSGYLAFTENGVADRWAIGIQPADGTLYFRAGQVTGTSVATLSSGGKLALATATIYGSANLTLPWVGTSSPTQAIYNIDTLTAAQYRGSFGDFVFKSSSSFANNAAQAMMYLAARNYGTAPGTANDVTQGVGLWIRGFYDNSGAAVPIYLGGYSYNGTNYGLVIDQSSRVTVGVGNSSSDTQKFNVVGNIKIAGAQNGNVANLIWTRTDASFSMNNETDLRWYSGSGDTDTPSTIRMTLSSADGNLLVGSTGASGSTMIKALSSVASGGTNITAHNYNDTGGGVTYAGINFIVGSDSGTSAIRSIRTNAGSDYQTSLQFLTNPAGATTTPTVKMTLSSLGYLNINTTDQAYRISVLGESGRFSDINGGSSRLRLASSEGGWSMQWGFANNAGTLLGGMFGGGSSQTMSTLGLYVNSNTSPTATFNSSGAVTINSTNSPGNFQGTVVAGANGSISSTSYPGASVYDTGITVNQSSGGGTLLFLCSVNSSAGFSTTSAVYMLQFAYDGNYVPNVTLVSGSNSWTFSKSGSNTLTVTGPAGNANYAWFGNK